jgi:hypothetical protein
MNDALKYIVVAGIILSILKLVPSKPLENKDIVLIMSIIIVGFIFLDVMYIHKKEGFANQESSQSMVEEKSSQDPFKLNLDIDVDQILKNRLDVINKVKMEEQPTMPEVRPEQIRPLPILNQAEQPKLDQLLPEVPIELRGVSDTAPKVGCGMEIEKVKRQFQNEIAELRNQLRTKPITIEDSSKIAARYFESLIVDLNQKGIIDANDIQNIQIKLKSKLLSMEDVIKSLETLKKEGKVRTRMVNGKVKNDNVYNELPSDFYTPIGDKIANEWDNEYTILNTNKWQVPMPRPPVCINTSPCKVCPSDSSTYPVNLKEWDDSRYVSQSKINKTWAMDQADA